VNSLGRFFPPILLSRLSFSSFRKEFDGASLPKVFREALIESVLFFLVIRSWNPQSTPKN